MRSAPRYANTIYKMICAFKPATNAVLDFGAGDGLFAEAFLKDGMRVTCVEPDLQNIDALERLGLNVLPSIERAEDRSFDFIYTINVLEHLHDLEAQLRQLHRTLTIDGRLFVFVPAFNLLWTSLDDEVGHVQRFTRSSLASALTKTGFTLESTRYFDSAGFPAALTVKVLEKLRLFRYSTSTVGFYDKAILPISLAGDHLLSSMIGKNVIALARKTEPAPKRRERISGETDGHRH
jgi:SAM-dependent methyltransferase